MAQAEFINVHRGPRAIANYLDPSLQPPLPLVEIPESLNPFRKDGVRIFAKMMCALPAHNVKFLPALHMLSNSNDISTKTKTIIEQSSGSTVISLSLVARIFHGIDDVRAYITNKTSASRMRMLRFFGLELVLYGGHSQPPPDDARGGIGMARKLHQQNESILNPNQYENELNWQSHVRWTGPQLLRQVPEIDILCSPMGTGGVITGTGSFLKKAKPGIVVVGVCNKDRDPVPGPRPFQLFDYVKFPWQKAVDTVEQISSVDSYHLSLLLSREGLICGPSSGMTLKGLYEFLQKAKDDRRLENMAGSDGFVTCVFMCCDLPYQYLEDYFVKLGPENFKPIVNENLIHVDKYQYETRWEISKREAMSILPQTSDQTGVMTSESSWDRADRRDSVVESECHGLAVVLDFRSAEDFADNHIPMAINFPLASLRQETKSPFADSKVLEAQWLDLEAMFQTGHVKEPFWKKLENRPVVLVCYEGDTSKIATSVLRSRGFEAVSIAGGMNAFSKLMADDRVEKIKEH